MSQRSGDIYTSQASFGSLGQEMSGNLGCVDVSTSLRHDESRAAKILQKKSATPKNGRFADFPVRDELRADWKVRETFGCAEKEKKKKEVAYGPPFKE